jgi:hypothetical protein
VAKIEILSLSASAGKASSASAGVADRRERTPCMSRLSLPLLPALQITWRTSMNASAAGRCTVLPRNMASARMAMSDRSCGKSCC